jgi:hypothetical protein
MKTALIWALLLFLPATVFAEALQTAFLPDGGEYLVDRFIVTTRSGIPPLATDQALAGIARTGIATLDYLCAEHQVTMIEPFYPTQVRNPIVRELVERMYIFHVAPGQNIVTAVHEFRTAGEVECADPYDIPHLAYTPNDPQRTSQWHLTRTRAYEAWDVIRGDTTAYAIIGIVDTGVYWAHPDLAANMWINIPEDINGNGTMDAGDYNGSDDDGNGYVDDVIGWDMGQNDNNPQELTPTHGTHVAGCASEVTDNNLNGAGLGFSARLMAVKGTNASGQLTAVYQGMAWAVDNGAHILNASWGSPTFSQTNQNLMTNFWNAGIVIISAAGNNYNSQRFYPAAYNNVVAVAATNNSDRKADFSSYGTWVDVSAPGVGIYATWASNQFTSLDGTSMASPITCGLAALLVAAHPTWTNEDVVSTILSSADTIDHLNPSYRGMLGTGRINAISALGAGSIPNITITQMTLAIRQGDGDTIINPGETFSVILNLHNQWADAINVNVRVNGQNFTAIDSTANFGNILHGGDANNQLDSLILTAAANVIPDSLPLNVIVTADSTYIDTIVVKIPVQLYQAGFPRSFTDLDCSPLLFDVDREGNREIIVGNSGVGNDCFVYMIESDGSDSPGWPQSVAGEIVSGPAVGDIDHNGTNEVVAVTKDGRFYAWSAAGVLVTGFPVVKGGAFYSGPLLADIDGNGDLEIIAGSFTDMRVYALDHTGADHPGWPTGAIHRWQGSPVTGNFDGDIAAEIVYAGFDSSVHVWNGDGTNVAGFPVHLNGPVWCTAAVGDIDNDGQIEIAVVAYNGNLFLINHDGSVAQGFPVNFGTSLRSSPALADLNNDGDLEIVFGTGAGTVRAIDYTGAEMAGFPQTLGGAFYGGPVIGDITGDAQPDIIIGSTNGITYGLDRNGVALPHFPMPALGDSRPISATPAIGYLDNDGDMEIVIPVKALWFNLIVIDYKQQASLSNLQWANFAHDSFRSGNYETVLIAASDNTELPTEFGLAQNYPNPFNATTTISFSIARDGQASLSIFDLLGRRVKVLQSGQVSAGQHSFIWDGRDESGHGVTSGLYFYKLDTTEGALTRKMVLLK